MDFGLVTAVVSATCAVLSMGGAGFAWWRENLSRRARAAAEEAERRAMEAGALSIAFMALSAIGAAISIALNLTAASERIAARLDPTPGGSSREASRSANRQQPETRPTGGQS